MALTWDLTKIANTDEVCWNGDGDDARMNGVTHALIFATIGVGLSDITEANIDEWELRLELLALTGPPMGTILVDGERKDWNASRADLEAHIGLHTNAQQWTRTQFKAAIWRGLMQTAQRNITRRSKEAA